MFGSGHSAGSPGGTRAGLTSSAAGEIQYHPPQKSWNTDVKSHSTSSQLLLQISTAQVAPPLTGLALFQWQEVSTCKPV